jgi:transposase
VADHPLRAVNRRADEVSSAMRRDFEKAYAKVGRPSIPPEMRLKALLLQALYSIRSERQLVDQIQMSLLYKWFIDLSLDAPAWNATTFTKNRERFEKHGLLRSSSSEWSRRRTWRSGPRTTTSRWAGP